MNTFIGEWHGRKSGMEVTGSPTREAFDKPRSLHENFNRQKGSVIWKRGELCEGRRHRGTAIKNDLRRSLPTNHHENEIFYFNSINSYNSLFESNISFGSMHLSNIKDLRNYLIFLKYFTYSFN